MVTLIRFERGCREDTCIPHESKLIARLTGSRPFRTMCVGGSKRF